jgi:hypothetical protein
MELGFFKVNRHPNGPQATTCESLGRQSPLGLADASVKTVTGGNQVFTVPTNTRGNPAQLLHNLNLGPNLRGITHADYDSRLPQGWRLSFGRVPDRPFAGDTSWFTALAASAFGEFERASASLLRSDDRSRVIPSIANGIATSRAMRAAYLDASSPFSIRRLDVVLSEQGPAVCENDEMPGGLVHAYWLDRVYGVNQRRWEQALRWLTSRGTLVFAVSTNWSAPYVQEISWLVQHLQNIGYAVKMVTDKKIHRVSTTGQDVSVDGQKVGAVWRLFPIFEAHGLFSRFVEAAQRNQLRLVPELASWGNKAWMGIFWQEQEFFRANMSPAAFRLLQGTLPYTSVVNSVASFPLTIQIGEDLVQVSSYDDLKALPMRQRKQIVAKSCGAHPRAARSHSVVIGGSVSGAKWAQLLDQLIGLDVPFILQRFRPPSRLQVPVWSVLSGEPKLENPFTGKVLVRPWVINGQLVSATAFVTTPDATKLHGTTTGAEVPLSFG